MTAPPRFLCPICHRVSHHPRDLAERFCEVCGFVDDRTGQAKACRHDAYKGMAVHGRCCPSCGTFMVDFGD